MPVADAPSLTVRRASGNEDTAIALTISSALTDTDGSETLSIKISGVPAGATLQPGTDNGDGSWTLTPAQLAGPHDHAARQQRCRLHADGDGDRDGRLGGDTDDHADTVPVTVNPVADAPTLTMPDASGNEDTAIALIYLLGADRHRRLGDAVDHHHRALPAGATLGRARTTATAAGR